MVVTARRGDTLGNRTALIVEDVAVSVSDGREHSTTCASCVGALNRNMSLFGYLSPTFETTISVRRFK